MALKDIFSWQDMTFTGTLQNNTPVDDGAGGQVDNWVNVLTTRCALIKRSGRLSDGMGKMEYQRDYMLICRYQTAIVLNADSRWLIRNEIYKITDHERVDMTPHLVQFNVIKQNG